MFVCYLFFNYVRDQERTLVQLSSIVCLFSADVIVLVGWMRSLHCRHDEGRNFGRGRGCVKYLATADEGNLMLI